jgi:hypothetical protein
MITIDEQIEHQSGICYATPSKYERAKLASLEKLKRIESVKVPVEPEEVEYLRVCLRKGSNKVTDYERVCIRHIDTLLDLLKRESARADAAHEVADSTTKGVWSETLLRYAKAIGEHQALGFDRNEWKERAEAAEAEADKQFQYAGRVLEQAHSAEAKRLLAEARKDAERCALLFQHWEADDKEKFCALIAEIRKDTK